MRFLKFAVIAALFALPVSSANAGVLTSLIGAVPDGGPLALNDDSRDFFVDVDGSDGVTVGDVLFGVVQIDSTSPPNIDTNNQLYGVFSQTFETVVVDLTDGTASGTFAPTAGKYSLDTLTGLDLNDDAFVAVFERAGGFSVDIDSFDIGDVPGVTDAETLIDSIVGEGAFDFSAGFRDGPGGVGPFGLADTGDFFGFQTDLSLAAINGALAGGPGAFTNNIQLGSFGGGLSVLDNNLGSVEFFDNLVAVSPFGNTFAEVTITGGTFSAVGGGTLENGIFPIINNADFQINAVVPEPGSIAIWGMLGFCGLTRRRRLS